MDNYTRCRHCHALQTIVSAVITGRPSHLRFISGSALPVSSRQKYEKMYLRDKNVAGDCSATCWKESIVPCEQLKHILLEVFACTDNFLNVSYLVIPPVWLIFWWCRLRILGKNRPARARWKKIYILRNRSCNLRLFLNVKTHGEKSCTQFILASGSVSARRE